MFSSQHDHNDTWGIPLRGTRKQNLGDILHSWMIQKVYLQPVIGQSQA